MMSLSAWNTLWQVLSGVFAGLAVLTTFAALYSGNKLSDIKDAEVAAIQKETAEANERTEKMRADALALQARLMPRRIAFGGVNGDNEKRAALFAKVKEYAGTSALIHVVPGDFEALSLGWQISEVLKVSGWKYSFSQAPFPTLGPMDEGVWVQTVEVMPDPWADVGPVFMARDRHGSAAHVLVDLLLLDLGGWGVRSSPMSEQFKELLGKTPGPEIPPKTVFIRVGMRPVSSMPAIWPEAQKAVPADANASTSTKKD